MRCQFAQLLEADRLDQYGVGLPVYRLGPLRITSDDNDTRPRQASILTDPAHNVASVHSGKVQVEHDYIWHNGCQPLQCGVAGTDHLGLDVVTANRYLLA